MYIYFYFQYALKRMTSIKKRKEGNAKTILKEAQDTLNHLLVQGRYYLEQRRSHRPLHQKAD